MISLLFPQIPLIRVFPSSDSTRSFTRHIPLYFTERREFFQDFLTKRTLPDLHYFYTAFSLPCCATAISIGACISGIVCCAISASRGISGTASTVFSCGLLISGRNRFLLSRHILIYGNRENQSDFLICGR